MTDQTTAPAAPGGFHPVAKALDELPAADRQAILRGAAGAAEGVAAMRHLQGDPAGEQSALDVMTALRRLADAAQPPARPPATRKRQSRAKP